MTLRKFFNTDWDCDFDIYDNISDTHHGEYQYNTKLTGNGIKMFKEILDLKCKVDIKRKNIIVDIASKNNPEHFKSVLDLFFWLLTGNISEYYNYYFYNLWRNKRKSGKK